ncbi:putative TetR-family transcriptional regulator [Actinoplanes missouriensis 431]|uniref:Putative TetR-family transcriptional regulator n=1 Tax=Actinoplanes missouriensis (strain ATCC 14538 / DSM 43046 / CBS 188.64 / JCM 3121 / NBRC 102363 / NCIMB 12654 / NRRL B-3342 / UNCC 431) TaxID=512565 RepID=I0GZK9_ACTM4|nr:TetR family transcriptional regulator C-terminal domain-containing protein [Actinoplanes missouriensis]BAL86196.1 putative TetR-family transcriptional regulator [Actinoplanes missouriensis 431]
MPKVVDHEERRRELAGAVWRVITRDGVAHVSMRTVAAESGWSSGALRHYFATRDELLAFACDQVLARVTARILALEPHGTPEEMVRTLLLETMPIDPERHTESSITFAFLVLGLSDPALAAVQRKMLIDMSDLCQSLTRHLLPDASPQQQLSVARRLNALVDGLSVHVLAGHLTPAEAVAELDAHLETVRVS